MKTLPRPIAFLAISVLAILALSSPVWAASYTITDLGNFGGTYTTANGINNSGQVVGSSKLTGYNGSRAFLYSNGAMQNLGTLGGHDSYASGINNNGQVVGKAYTAGYYTQPHAFLYSSGVMTDLGTLQSGRYAQSYASGINNNGQVVGTSDAIVGYSTTQHAFLYSDGIMTDIGPTVSPVSRAVGINDNGQIVINGNDTGGLAWHAYLYSNGAMTELGGFGSIYGTLAYGINNSGQVVGYSYLADNHSSHAFLYSNGAMQDLGTLGGQYSSAASINNYGLVVGSAHTAANVFHAYLYSNGTMLDLNSLLSPDSGWSALNAATGINDLGQIVGTGIINGQTHAYLLTPTAVPVPSSAWLLGAGLFGLFGVGRRR